MKKLIPAVALVLGSLTGCCLLSDDTSDDSSWSFSSSSSHPDRPTCSCPSPKGSSAVQRTVTTYIHH